MLGASFLPARFRNDHTSGTNTNPGYLNRLITPLLQSISRRAFHHPIRTVVFVALLASTSYVGLLEGSFFDGYSTGVGVNTDLSSLVEHSRRLELGEDTTWKWQVDSAIANDTKAQHLALLTLVFPGSLSNFARTAPSVGNVPISEKTTALSLPSTLNPLSSISQDSSLAFSVPFDETSEFLDVVKELPNEAAFPNSLPVDIHGSTAWVMKAAKSNESASQNPVNRLGSNAWTNFVDLIKVCNDILCHVNHAKSNHRMRNLSILSSWSLDICLCT